MFARRPTSEDRRVYLARFEFEGQSGGVYLDGAYTTRGFVSEDERELRRRLERLIEEGRLSLDAGGKNRPEIVSVDRRGDIITVKIRGRPVERAGLRLPRLTRRERHRMHPVLDYDLARRVREMLERNQFYDFVELLESFTPLIEERGVTPFDGKTIHPISTRTILSEMNVYSKGLSPRHKREARTAILLDRSMSMANAWSLWEEYPR